MGYVLVMTAICKLFSGRKTSTQCRRSTSSYYMYTRHFLKHRLLRN